MGYEDLSYFLNHVGKDPARLIFEDELTGLYNRRFLLNYFQHKVNWADLDATPLSLIIVDLDHFKEINDRYGHDMGDQALAWAADLLKEVAGDEGIPIRYAGDEFAIVLPRAHKHKAIQVSESLLKLTHEEPFRLRGEDETLKITFSIGVATAPDDAQSGKELIHRADTALYFCKKSGRDRLADANQISPQAVFAKTALYKLEGAKIAGCEPQLAQVAEALKKFSKCQSQFLIFEGGSGMGKSEFLETVRRCLSGDKMQTVKVKCVPQELLKPYGLATNILVTLLNQRQDKGAEVLQSLSPKEMVYLSYILPQLLDGEELAHLEDERSVRDGIFTTLLHFISKALAYRSYILLIDDLHFADAATLILLRQLLLRGDMPLFICACSIEIKQLVGREQLVPLGGFAAAHTEELGICLLKLTPLSARDIAEHLQRIFPQLSVPDNLPDDLAHLTQGNPLFLAEILRKLVLDQNVVLIGQQWKIQSLEEGYLPQSLEEIVIQKLAALDEESRQLLDQASVLGEEFSLSYLIGSSEKMEAKVLEFVDKAVAQGLLRTDFEIDDKAIHFLGKSILETTYGAIQQHRRHELHEHIGNYQENLFQQGVFNSVATLAYHFERSANQDKVEEYRQLQTADNKNLFNIEEALDYTLEKPSEDSLRDVSFRPEPGERRRTWHSH
jgi:diguanylate cyclase (GGDEF)-like protein